MQFVPTTETWMTNIHHTSRVLVIGGSVTGATQMTEKHEHHTKHCTNSVQTKHFELVKIKTQYKTPSHALHLCVTTLKWTTSNSKTSDKMGAAN